MTLLFLTCFAFGGAGDGAAGRAAVGGGTSSSPRCRCFGAATA